MEVKLLLIAFLLLVQDSLAVWRNVTVIKGQTLHLHCPIKNAHKTTVEWRNPQNNIMFFNKNRVLRNKKYRIDRLSMSEFTVSVSNVTISDGGIYTCSHYGHQTIEKQVKVTVLSLPVISFTQHDGRMAIKCVAEGNYHAPEISWKLDKGPEIFPQAQVHTEDNKYVSVDVLQIHSVDTTVTVKCLVRHPALHLPALMNFIKVERNGAKFHATTTISLPKTELLESTEALTKMPTRSGHGKTTTVSLTTSDVNKSPSVSHNKTSAVSSNHTFSSSEPQTITVPTVFPDNTITATDSHFSPTGWTSIDQTTENSVFNNTERNNTVNQNELDMRRGRNGSSSLLVFLVTCLIFCLLVVVVFFAVKLRRAHIIWRKENEDSDPSEDSSKSKSSQEEKNNKEQKRRGHLNTAFTQYVTEGPTVATVTNTGATTGSACVNMEQMSQPQTSIKETEL
ncbi:cytotoxic and regulatory T-cell molecule isoform X2 [Cynoglossus semilaevis]|uniref:Cytotoxic and regulatory T cell molecule n=1 Tax=Cynoglossus semilaevis TaxID=244447 RepID=A0A3P8X0Z6_CYNSE|nr:cytotoxic and regulatory T-cell molecule isoform X2 [Cynoglossus semilaevis]